MGRSGLNGVAGIGVFNASALTASAAGGGATSSAGALSH